MSELKEGDMMPAFELPTDGGGTVSSESLKGKPYVLYLYPRDDTPGCTKEAQGFTEHKAAFAALGVPVVGLSKDDVASHDKFKTKYDLDLVLASDESGKLVEGLGAWVEKSNYGKTYMGIDRSTFLVDGDGRIVRAWRKVKVPGHVEEVLDAARALGN
ncbi:MAG: peroxiredoxin [Geminicoccaceae bacterium]|nr:peroxiredoxin [Geminicoccaceae bacterium]MCB9968826.1 peroxiredoxin [Geminicoccaceae bacterium]HRY24349.1 peroxiredoxin [Geminicoccaceae bacterium]